MDQPTTREAIATLLRQHSTLTLATRAPNGGVMAASLLYASDEALHIYWMSGRGSRHSRNLERAPAAALTVHHEAWDPSAIKGVQMEGIAAPMPAGPPREAAWARFLLKFPFVRDLEAEIAASVFYEFIPHRARLIDNAFGFGFKAELRLV